MTWLCFVFVQSVFVFVELTLAVDEMLERLVDVLVAAGALPAAGLCTLNQSS
jgi:hypothetical protein